ncbi:MAG: hypothetical protein V7607_5624 [Solirubrobacteraceae bacterium]
MRVAIAGIHHETNTFSPVRADLAAFTRAGVLRRDEIPRQHAQARSTIAGYLRAAEADGRVDVVPLLFADLTPCGTITAEAFETLSSEIVAGLVASGPFDVVLLAQHGAAVSEEHAEADGELARRVRAAVGPDVTIAAVLDLHANVTQAFIDAVDVCVGYRENPHRDPDRRGAECAQLAFAHARAEAKAISCLIRLPMVVPILGGWTGNGAMAELMAHGDEVARSHALLSYTVFHGFGYTDVPQMGSAVLAVADGDAAVAQAAARELAVELWQRREDLAGRAFAPGDAVREVLGRQSTNGPIVVLDVGDNVGAGAPGDSTVLLAEALEQRIDGLVATLSDADAVAVGVASGEGAEIEVEAGAATSVSVGPKLRLAGRVVRITDGRFEDPRPTHGGRRYFDGGPTVRIATREGPEVVVSSLPLATRSPEQLRAVGIEPSEQRVVIAKGVVAPRAGYEPVASGFVVADTPGITSADLATLPYVRRSAPLWPLEPDVAELSTVGDAGT